MPVKNNMFVLSNNRLAAVNKKDGEIIWQVKLKDYLSRGISLGIGQLMVEGDKIFISATGILLCVNAKNGSLIWKNELKGWGYYYISMADQNTSSAAAIQQANAAASTAVTVAAT